MSQLFPPLNSVFILLPLSNVSGDIALFVFTLAGFPLWRNVKFYPPHCGDCLSLCRGDSGPRAARSSPDLAASLLLLCAADLQQCLWSYGQINANKKTMILAQTELPRHRFRRSLPRSLETSSLVRLKRLDEDFIRFFTPFAK